MTTADKLEAEAKRLRIKAGEPNLQTSKRLLAIAERDEALAAAWRALDPDLLMECAGHLEAESQAVYADPLRALAAAQRKAENMINALEIE